MGSGEDLGDRARAWVEAHTPHPVESITPVGGGITNTKWLVRLSDADPLVLRWADPVAWGAIGREHVRREALGLRLLAGSDLPVARLLATDPDGSGAGGAANVMTWLSGAVRLDPLEPAAVSSLAQAAVAVHGHPVSPRERPPVFSYRGPAEPEVPAWTRRPDLWRRAIEEFTAGPPSTTYRLIHRDFHLGNTLWRGAEVSGLVDWAETSWGPPDLDVAHLGADFAMMHGVAEAAAFRRAYVRAGGRLEPDPVAARFWIIADVIGFLPDPAHILPAVTGERPDLTADAIRTRLEDLLAASFV